MKKLGKVLLAAAVLAAAAQGAWAGRYKGDLQFDAGFRNNKLEADLKGSDYDYDTYQRVSYKVPVEETEGAFSIGLTNYNLFDIIPVLSVGFMDSLTGYFGDIRGFDFLIGPAIGANVFDVVKFQCAFGLSLGVGYSEGNDNYSAVGVGFGIDAQAKFIPAKRVSPLVGFRYEMSKLGDHEDIVNGTLKSVAVYCGGSINFGI